MTATKFRPPRVLFLRRFRVFRGAHLTAWNYFQHLKTSGRYEPFAWFSEDSALTDANPWMRERDRIVREWRLADYDAVVLGGRGWEFLTPAEREAPPVPVVQMVLHVNRADPADETFAYLRHPAVRVAITEEIEARLAASGVVAGPVMLNPHGLDAESFPPARADLDRDLDVLLLGVKRRDVAERVGRALGLGSRASPRRGVAVLRPVPRPKLLALMARARVAVLVPNLREGFYRPPLEAMALGALVVCPRFEGNSGVCDPGVNCLMPEPTETAIAEAAEEALRMPPARRAAMLDAARVTANRRSLADERARFLEIMDLAVREGARRPVRCAPK